MRRALRFAHLTKNMAFLFIVDHSSIAVCGARVLVELLTVEFRM